MQIPKANIPDQASIPVVIKSAPINEIVRAFRILSLPNLKQQKNDFTGKIQSFTPDQPVATSPLGTPVMQDITFKSVTYTDFTTGIKKTTQELTFQNILLRVEQAKKIVKTSIPGRPGTIKEYIGLDDYQVTINGILTAQNGQGIADQLIPLKDTLVASRRTSDGSPVSIPVVCGYLNNWGIFNLVVQDFTLDQEPGGYSKQNFTINCLSDQDVILQIL